MENMTEEEKAEQEKKFRVSGKALMLTVFQEILMRHNREKEKAQISARG